MRVPKRKSEENRKYGDKGGPVHMTQDAYDQMQRKLERLKAALPSLQAEVARTGAFGDFSENFEYQDAKRKLRGTLRGVDVTEDKLSRAVIIQPGSGDDSVQLGSTVELEINGRMKTFFIVGPHESDPPAGRIPHESPLGAAILGRAQGEEVELEAGGNTQDIRIIAIS